MTWPFWMRAVWWVRRPLSRYGPVDWFGGRVTHYWFGLDIRLRRAYLCIHWRDSVNGPVRLRVYQSPDATPYAATRWFLGRRSRW